MVSLGTVAPQSEQVVRLLGAFDPFRHDFQPQAVPKHENGTGDGLIVCIHQHIAHKTLVDLDPVQGKALEIGKRRVPGTEIIQCQTNPQGMQILELPDHEIGIVENRTFSDFQLQVMRFKPGMLQQHGHFFGQLAAT